MLTEICGHLKNWFIAHGGNHHGEFEVVNGGIDLPFLSSGQYFRVMGSTFNDGVHQYPTTSLMDERFSGAIWAMAVPPAVVALSAEIEKWQEDNGSKVAGPYASESFGGYGYTKATTPSGNIGSWHDAFRTRLNPWRKI